MLDNNLILQMFANLSECTVEEVKNKSLIIDDAAYYIENMLLEDIDIEKNSHLVHLAAAKLAYYNDMMIKMCASGDTQISAGDISQKTDYSNAYKIASNLKDDALLSIMHLCKDEEFTFEVI